ncbi:unnamed protein product [Cuscuta campestris]|uniref:Uncharacterized protein n=1 Tax=Cuscuta campestris TaxID=132261 RepID=A0A484M353_9ASTE|nr:unnamed protein product [Cuscuta campestris]
MCTDSVDQKKKRKKRSADRRHQKRQERTGRRAESPPPPPDADAESPTCTPPPSRFQSLQASSLRSRKSSLTRLGFFNLRHASAAPSPIIVPIIVSAPYSCSIPVSNAKRKYPDELLSPIVQS